LINVKLAHLMPQGGESHALWHTTFVAVPSLISGRGSPDGIGMGKVNKI